MNFSACLVKSILSSLFFVLTASAGTGEIIIKSQNQDLNLFGNQSIFYNGFDLKTATVIYSDQTGEFKEINGCELVSFNIDRQNAYANNSYKFTCAETIDSNIYGNNRDSGVLINDKGIYCNIDYFEYHSPVIFTLLIICE